MFEIFTAIVADADVQVIYIATPHSFHCDNIVLCLEAGKHVLSEKPMVVNAAQAELIRGAIRSGGLDNLTQIVDTVRECGGLQYTIDRAAEHTRLALEALEPVANSKYKEALYTLAEESLKRTH